MKARTRNSSLTNAEIRAIIDDTERQALGGARGAIARAGLGTVAIVLAVFASTDSQTVGLILLSGVFILGLAAYIRSVARSVSMKPRISAQPQRQEAVPPTASPETSPVTPASPETSPVTPAPPETSPVTPAAPLSGIAGGAWSRLSHKHEA
jgi:hypothetical protein